MRKTITVEEDVYNTLVQLKEGTGDSFSKVIRRHVHVPAKTNEELLEWQEKQPRPNVDLDILDRVLRERGRQSIGRK